jgi:hypothetical protein
VFKEVNINKDKKPQAIAPALISAEEIAHQ